VDRLSSDAAAAAYGAPHFVSGSGCARGGKIGRLGCIGRIPVMVSGSEDDRTLEAAVGDIPRVAELIAAIPTEHRAAALRAAELSYLRTAQDFGYAEGAAQQWAAAVASRLRIEAEKKRWTTRMQLKLLYGEALRAGLGAVDKDPEEQLP
jgi:hypothetical protein